MSVISLNTQTQAGLLAVSSDDNNNIIITHSEDVAESQLFKSAKPVLVSKSFSVKNRGRKTQQPSKAITKNDQVPGVLMKFGIDCYTSSSSSLGATAAGGRNTSHDHLKIQLTKLPVEYPAFQETLHSRRLMAGPKRRRSSSGRQNVLLPRELFYDGKNELDEEFYKNGTHDDDGVSSDSYPSNELFYSSKSQMDDISDYYEQMLRPVVFGGGSGANSFKRRRYNSFADLSDREDSYNNNNVDELSEVEDELTPPATPRDFKKPQKRKRFRAKSVGATDKVCVSCHTNQTPIWRQVKENWGEGWQEVSLCNGCSLQFRMSGLRCNSCNYVPRQSEKQSKTCTRCPSGKFAKPSVA